METNRRISRRSFLSRVAGGAIVAGGAMGIVSPPEARAQVTDADSGARADVGGRGRTAPGLTDSDTRTYNRDPIGFGRGNRQRGIEDVDEGLRGDPTGRGRGTTDVDRMRGNGDRPGYGRGTSPTRARAGGGNATGTGFFIAADGHILTSNHVIQGAQAIHVTTSSGERLPARLVRASAATDVAVLKIEGTPPRHLTLGSARAVQSGARVFTVGFPIADVLGREPRYTEGTVSALSGPGGDQTFLQISVPVQPGNSGGPLLSEGGEVIGIIAASAAVSAFFARTGALPQNLNWAVKSDYAAPMVDPGTPVTYPNREAAIAAATASVVFLESTRE